MASQILRTTVGFAALWLAVCGGGCGLRGLAHDQLFGSSDAGAAPPRDAVDAPADSADAPADSADAPADIVDAPADIVDAPPVGDLLADARVDSEGDAAAGPDTTSACTAGSCPSDQFCDDLTGACAPRIGVGMLSGAVIDACTHRSINAKVGIAGHHQCTDQQKGSFFFHDLPYGKLTLTSAAPGYRLFEAVVVIVPGGNVLDVPLVPDTPNGCADPPPPLTMCTCVGAGCAPP